MLRVHSVETILEQPENKEWAETVFCCNQFRLLNEQNSILLNVIPIAE